MIYKFTIKGRLDGLNKVIDANRSNTYMGAKVKRKNDDICKSYILEQLQRLQIAAPVIIKFDWYEKDKRRDLDNIFSAKKFILDALVKANVLPDDSQKYVVDLVDHIHTDKLAPRIEVTIIET